MGMIVRKFLYQFHNLKKNSSNINPKYKNSYKKMIKLKFLSVSSNLFSKNIIYVGLPFYVNVVELLIAQIIYLQNSCQYRYIIFYINSIGQTSSVFHINYGLVLSDILNMVKLKKVTVNLSFVADESIFLLISGDKNDRYTLHNSLVSLRYNEKYKLSERQINNFKIIWNELAYNKLSMLCKLSYLTHNSLYRTEKYVFNKNFLNSRESKSFGLIDRILKY